MIRTIDAASRPSNPTEVAGGTAIFKNTTTNSETTANIINKKTFKKNANLKPLATPGTPQRWLEAQP